MESDIMKALIDISGDWQDTYVTAYVHPKYKHEQNPDRINGEAITEDGFDCVVRIHPSSSGHNLRVIVAPEFEDRSFLFVNINSPWKVFDESLVWSNLEIEVHRSHSLIGWVIYGTLTLARKVKRLFK
jgi:hypothetical protein